MQIWYHFTWGTWAVMEFRVWYSSGSWALRTPILLLLIITYYKVKFKINHSKTLIRAKIYVNYNNYINILNNSYLKLMIVSGIFYFMFLGHSWLQVNETAEAETTDKGGVGTTQYLFLAFIFLFTLILSLSGWNFILSYDIWIFVSCLNSCLEIKHGKGKERI
jgi:hypothetical protein